MEPTQSSKTTAKDFFLHLGAIVALYTVTANFVTLLFRVINEVFPQIGGYGNGYYWDYRSEISMPVATLIIVFPIFVLLSWFVYKTYTMDESKKHLAIRKWLTYTTLFVAGIILIGDLVMVLYKFLDGQDLTAAFLLKALTVLLVSGAVFGYYLQDIREKISSQGRKWWALSVGILILASIALGFVILGSPRNQRLMRMDNQKIIDLQNMQSQVIIYWQQNGSLPEQWQPKYLQYNSAEMYEYKKNGDMSFEVCADFNRKSKKNISEDMGFYSNVRLMGGNDDWSHGSGRHCFERTIDPVAYPVYSKPLR